MKNAGQLLSDKLYQLAQRRAQASGSALARGFSEDAVADAGLALEYVAKAYLAHRHPLLLVAADRGQIDPEGLVWALGSGDDEMRGRSISAGEAVRRCRALVPPLKGIETKIVLDARNGVLHAGTADATVTDRVIAGTVAACDKLLPPIGHDSAGLWGHYRDSVFDRLEKRRDQTTTRVRDAISAARDRWEADFKYRGTEWLQALQVLTEDLPPDESTTSCPACPGKAILAGDIEYDEIPDYDRHGVVSVTRVPYLLYPKNLRCPACALRLRGRDELLAAGVPESVSIQDVGDPGEW